MSRHTTKKALRGISRAARIASTGNKAHWVGISVFCGSVKFLWLPDNWRERLPDPTNYYGQRVAKLGKPNGNGYAVGLCPFHDDHNPSFGVKLTSGRGHWCCYSGCGKGDMVEFHQRLTGQDFRDAVSDLLEIAG